jgi:flagellar motor switch protein FliG
MSVYARFKRTPEGFRALIELLETTPVSRRQKMIDVGNAEDREYTERALKFMLTFEDVINLPDMELAEVIATAPPRMTGYAISKSSKEIQDRFLKNSIARLAGEIRDFMQTTIGLREVGGAQLKLVEVTRQLEKKGLVKTKQIPLVGGNHY